MSTILRLELESDTPIFLGSFDTQSHEWDLFRTQSLKGLWRWWLRAYILGALYRAGYLGYRLSHKRLAELNRKVLNTINCLTSNILGGTNQASKIVLKATIKKYPYRPISSCPSYGDPHCNLQRVRLLTVGGRRVNYITGETLEVELSLRPGVRLSHDEQILAIGSLLTALTLNGIGKMGRRGVGTFTVRVVHSLDLPRDWVKAGTINLDNLQHIIRSTMKIADEYVLSSKCIKDLPKVNYPSDLPPCDLISDNFVDISGIKVDIKKEIEVPNTHPSLSIVRNNRMPIFAIYEVRWSGKVISHVLRELQDFFYRPGRIKNLYGGANTPYGHWQCYISSNKLSWFLGLPRNQKGTGYNVQDIERRASPIHLAVHRDRAYFTIFLSLDWPTQIVWTGAGSRTININRDEIISTSMRVLAYLETYLRKLGYNFKVIFP